jgi:hypothetical protein
MPIDNTLLKLRPDRDLQCYFQRPSAIAALSDTARDKFTVSGSWRQQFDWAVVEWNRDNVFEHPSFRNLPDGDLSGLTLTYEEVRENCIPLDSTLYPTVDWPSLRLWCGTGATEAFHRVPLKNYAVAVAGSYAPATSIFQMQGTATANDYIGLAWLSEHFTYQVYGIDTIDTILDALVASVNAFSAYMRAVKIGQAIQLSWVGPGQTATSTEGANGNRVGIYSYASTGATASWTEPWQQMSGGTSPVKWRITLPFASLLDENGVAVPTQAVRKMRWTYAADLQAGAFQRSEFAVSVSNWAVSGSGTTYTVAGPGSRRIEDDSDVLLYGGSWIAAPGNFSGASIRSSIHPDATVTCTYQSPQNHKLFLGTRRAFNGTQVSISVDGQPANMFDLHLADEDVLSRIFLGDLGPGSHTVTLRHAGAAGAYLYFDFFEIAIPSGTVPVYPDQPAVTAATDWDTDHSIALAPERTAAMIGSLGFRGRANHYVGALWFYELTRTGHQYASATVTLSGTPDPNQIAQITIGRVGQAPGSQTVLQHLNLIGDTVETVAKWFEMEINRGYTAIRAEANAGVLTIYSRSMGLDGNHLTIAASTNAAGLQIVASGNFFAGGVDGTWHTDLTAAVKVNRAARDWCRSFYRALAIQGLDAVAAFSTELQHGDTSLEAGIAQRYPSGNAVTVNTPATQTNFSLTSLAFWRDVYLQMATVMQEAGMQPYMQFGEVQYWYFPDDLSGLPLYDDYTKSRFRTAYGREMAVITNSSVLPSIYPDEATLLPLLIGEFTLAIMNYVRAPLPSCRFEVLYPVDVNDTPFNRAINYPVNYWTPAALDCLKTESFTYTYGRNLNLCKASIEFGAALGFPLHKRSHLIGVGDPVSPWVQEMQLAMAEHAESVVLFALDQFCLMGYPVSIYKGLRRSVALA